MYVDRTSSGDEISEIHVNSGGGRDGGRRDGRRKDEESDRGCSVMYVDGTSSGSQLLV